ncbi:MAG: DegT/DnrJ/EryC1/StrS family aminotransferase [Bdellovibrionota bacterium]
MISFQNFKRQWEEVGAEVEKAMSKLGSTGWYILGNSLQEFEKALAKHTDFSYCQGVGNGLDAIEISLRSLGIRSGDKVLTTPLSAFATTLAIIRAGGCPVFCDTDENGLIDLKLASEAIEKHKIKYFVPVHLFGQMLDIEALNEIKERTDIRIVEDAAQSICGHHLFDIETKSDFIATSFYPTKNLGAMGDGGAILTNQSSLNDKASYLKNYGQTDKYVHSHLGMNSRLDELQSAILLVHLKYLDQWLKKRAAIGKKYLQQINNPAIRKISSQVTRNVWHIFPVFLSDSAARERFVHFLKENNIQTSIHFPHLIPDQQAMKEIDTLIFGKLVHANQISQAVVSLPLHPYLLDEEVEKIISVCNNWKG